MNTIEHVRNDSNSGSVGNCVNTASIWLILWEMHFQGGVDTCISSWRSSEERERERNGRKNGDRLVAARTTTDGIKSNMYLQVRRLKFRILTINQLAMRSFYAAYTLYTMSSFYSDQRITFHQVQRVQ